MHFWKPEALVDPDGGLWRAGKQVWPPEPLPEGAMRVAPGTDAVVWRIQPDYSGEL